MDGRTIGGFDMIEFTYTPFASVGTLSTGLVLFAT